MRVARRMAQQISIVAISGMILKSTSGLPKLFNSGFSRSLRSGSESHLMTLISVSRLTATASLHARR